MLEARFASGSRIGAGSLKRATVEVTWDEQLGTFASFILTNAIAVFEDYLSTLVALSDFGDSKKRAIEKQLQFPTGASNGGVTQALTTLGVSNLFIGNVTWDKRITERIDEGGIDRLLICYRYFKEIRNSVAHNGGRVGQRQLDAQAEFSHAINSGKIGRANAPQFHSAQSVGDEVKLSYRGVIGFSEVLLHIVATYDCVFAKTPLAENEMKAILQPDKQIWPTSEAGKIRRFNKVFDPSKFPKITPAPTVVAYLKSEGLIPQSVHL
ncbi:hypothetical protein GCM10017322_18060 [Paracoccus aerius]|nr:hypothetical protein GCM10017322_18060 [Paracoccus aerius]